MGYNEPKITEIKVEASKSSKTKDTNNNLLSYATVLKANTKNNDNAKTTEVTMKDVLKEAFEFSLNPKSKINKGINNLIWKIGADKYLRKKEYLTSAWLLEHSLEKNPSDVVRGDDSRIAQLIKNK